MTFDDVLERVVEASPELAPHLAPGEVVAILVLRLSNTDVLPANKTNQASSSTNIEITSGANESPSKTEDFFPTLTFTSHFSKQRLRLDVRVSPRNIASLGNDTPAAEDPWSSDHLQVNRRRALNDGVNPSLHVGFGDDIVDLRTQMHPDDYLVFLRRKGSTVIDALGFKADVDLGNGKAIFLADATASGAKVVFDAPVTGSLAGPAALVQRLLAERTNVIVYGPPGTGKTATAYAVADAWAAQHGGASVIRVTFHPSFAYEDFVQGWRPVEGQPGHYVLAPGALLEAVRRSKDGEGPILMVIDEINRADVARVFGELITTIEPDKRGQPISLSQSPTTPVSLPQDLYFLGTMNTADKSVSLLDVALRRRFAFVGLPPDPSVFGDPESGWAEAVEGIPLAQVLRGLNRRLETTLGVSPDRAVGHALLRVDADAADPMAALVDRIRFDILPLVEEFAYFDLMRIREVFGGLVDDHGVLVEASTAQWKTWLEALVAEVPQTPDAVVADGDDDD